MQPVPPFDDSTWASFNECGRLQSTVRSAGCVATTLQPTRPTEPRARRRLSVSRDRGILLYAVQTQAWWRAKRAPSAVVCSGWCISGRDFQTLLKTENTPPHDPHLPPTRAGARGWGMGGLGRDVFFVLKKTRLAASGWMLKL